MLARLAVPFADASAGQLTWVLSSAAAPPLAAVSVLVGDAVVHLAVLGASHQVEAHLPGAPACVESVTCEGDGLSPLPPEAEQVVGCLHYRFSSRVEHLDIEGFVARARELRSRLGADPCALVASFPGHADAVTGLAVAPDGVGVTWRTWHAYPATGELVRTSTRLAPR